MKLASFLFALNSAKLSPFHDDIIYNIDFVGEKADLNIPGVKYDEEDFVIMKTPHNEEYKCYLPQDQGTKDDDIEETGEPAERLLDPIFKVGANNKPQCSFKLETYWSYEVCHGKYIRQYHDEKIKGGTKTTEYYLGYYKGPLPMPIDEEKLPKSRDEVTKKMIDGIETPYFELVMDGGTPCPLKAGQNRKTRVQYICNAQAFHNEILSITETRTCEYEIQILTSALCKSPFYAQRLDTDTFGIPCEKVGTSPTIPVGYTKPEKPIDLSALGLGQLGAVSITTIDTKTGEVKQISQEELSKILEKEAEEIAKGKDPAPEQINIDELQKILQNIDPNGDMNQVQEQIAKAIMKEVKSKDTKTAELKAKQETIQSKKVEDALKRPRAVLDAETQKILHSFLQGEYCLRGGTGWWKYEFCYGKHVLQYHEWAAELTEEEMIMAFLGIEFEAGKPKRERDEIFVGKWDEKTHLDYAKNSKKSVVTREPVAKGAKTTKPVKEAPKTPVDEQSIDEDGNPISVWNPDEPETDSDGKGRVSQVELFYSNGDICDITGEPREVIVRLKCKPGAANLALYLLEPKTCSYILGLESQLLCQLLTDVDENGLIQL